MEQEAHTPDQYKVLASYYSERQTTYLAKAAEAKQEWDRRSGNTMLTASKYPRPVDSAHYLYDYYATVAREAEQTALKYKQLAASQSGVN